MIYNEGITLQNTTVLAHVITLKMFCDPFRKRDVVVFDSLFTVETLHKLGKHFPTS